MSNHTTSREIKTAEPLWDDVWEQQIYHPCIHVLMLPHIEPEVSCVCTWRPHELLIRESSVSSLPYRAAVLAPFCCCSLKTSQDDCRGRWMLARLRGFTYRCLFRMRVSAECLRGKDTNTVQQAGTPRAGRTNRWVQALKRTGVFFTVMFSLHLNPRAIVQQRAASLHMFGYC